MESSNYANRLKSLVNFNKYENPPAEFKEVSRFTVKQGKMISQINDKIFYFPDSILSLPYGRQALAEIDEFKK